MLRIRDAIDEWQRDGSTTQQPRRRDRQSSDDEEERDRVQVNEPTDENTARYFSTGATPVAVDVTDYERLPFGFMASEVSIRHSDDIVVAFRNPHQFPSAAITSRGEATFTFGGDPPLETAFMWVKKADSASSDPTIEVLAY